MPVTLSANRLKSAIESQQTTASKLAENSGVSRAQIYRLLRSEQSAVQDATLRRLSDALEEITHVIAGLLIIVQFGDCILGQRVVDQLFHRTTYELASIDEYSALCAFDQNAIFFLAANDYFLPTRILTLDHERVCRVVPVVLRGVTLLQRY